VQAPVGKVVPVAKGAKEVVQKEVIPEDVAFKTMLE
jgi:hypothetical protein